MTINLSTVVNYSAKVHTDEIGVTVAPLDNNGLVPSANLPSYVDDVLEFADLASFPSVGDAGVIYIAIDTNTDYRWSGSVYVAIGQTPDVVGIGATAFVRFNASQSLSGANQIQARSNLGLGSMAVETAIDYVTVVNSRYTFNNQTGSSYAIVASDVTPNGKVLVIVSDPGAISVTIDPPSALGKVVGDSTTIIQGDDGVITVTASGGATLSSTAVFGGINKAMTFVADTSNSWRVIGV